MKKIILLILAVSFMFGYEITMSKTFIVEVVPNNLSIFVNIRAEGKTMQDTLHKLKNYNNFIKSFRKLKIKNGKFNTQPKYKMVDNKRIKSGYTGSIYYQIVSKNPKRLQRFISQLSAKSTMDDVDIYISSSVWRPSKKKLQMVKDNLTIQAIKWGKQYARELSRKVHNRCGVSKIDFDGSLFPSKPPLYKRANTLTLAPIPKKTNKELSVTVNYKFECK